VRPLSDRERRAIAAAPDVDAAMRDELSLPRTEGRGEALLSAIQRPALNFRGISGGEVGPRATNSIPTEASVSIDFRLVPDQTLEQVRRAFEDHVRSRGYTITGDVPDA
jgi:acetylornithine deacetylase/succinyl-diaminopimelate desuccinylase-like protein